MIIGIDPGLTGAIAFIGRNGYMVEDLPTMANGKGQARVKRQINARELSAIIDQNAEQPATIYIERVASMPAQGSASIFSLGDTFGAIRSVCAVLGYPVEFITPQKWKIWYGVGKDKEIIRTKAIELFPDAPLARKKDHNRGEALLIDNNGKHKEND